ncbi:MAG: hypothetical protein ACYC4T_06630 [Melioribacteraceae bacterium]
MGNINLSGSFIVGGIVLLALLFIHFRMQDANRSQIINEFTESSMTNMADVLDYDFNKIGYRVSTNPKISSINNSSISFLADLDNNGSIDSVKYFTRVTNGRQYLVRRTTNSSVRESQIVISNFLLQGFDSLNNNTFNASSIKSIEMQIVIDNNSFRSDTTSNFGSYYKRRYFIHNK